MHTLARSTQQAVEFLRQASKEIPTAAVVLGSGVSVLENLPEQVQFSYDQVFGLSPTIAGHAGSLSLGRVDGHLVAVFRGRFHLYEGHSWEVVTLPARVIAEWGVPRLYLTNAAGGINSNFQIGDLMLLTGYRDHLSPKWQESGLLPTLHASSHNCENQLTADLWATASKLAQQDKTFRPLRKGVYSAVLGPSYETHAEITMLRKLKSDAVGMSTVPELIATEGSSTTSAAISVVTNVWKEDVPIDGHEEVLRAAREASGRLDKLFRAAIVS